MRNDAYFNRIWYEGEPPSLLLRMLALLYLGVTALRRGLYRAGIFSAWHPGVPVIVIGNLVSGGAGKTPLTIALARELARHGFTPGIVSRGYGGKSGKVPLLVSAEMSATIVGDEALLMARRTGVPVCVHPRRAEAVRTLLEASNVDIVLCDDGLQHHALARDIEIAVVDGRRGLGNGRLLPAGPLRELPRRLHGVDHVVINGLLSSSAKTSLPPLPENTVRMQLQPVALVNLVSGERFEPDALAGERCAAIAGIGNPQRFFETLSELGYAAECRAFPDHHQYTREELAFADGRPLLMTEKDAMKCREFARDDWWYLEVGAVLEADFVARLVAQVTRVPGGRNKEKTR